MVEEQRSLKCDVVGPDGVVLLFHGKISSVFESLTHHSYEPLDDFNFSILSVNPSDLDDRAHVRQKLTHCLRAINAGELDAMFRKAASIQEAMHQGTKPGQPTVLRDMAIQSLERYLEEPDGVDRFIRAAQKAIADTKKHNITSVNDGQLAAVREYFSSPQSPLPASLDRLFASERVPLIVADRHTQELLSNKSPVTSPVEGVLAPVLVEIDTAVIEGDQKAKDNAALLLATQIFDRLRPQKLEVLQDEDLNKLPDTDVEKVKYQIDRKRNQIKSYNRTACRPIRMFPDETTLRHNSTGMSVARMPLGLMTEAHHLLVNYQATSERSAIRDRFDHVVRFHDAAMKEIDRKIDERLQAARLPPPAPHETEHVGEPEPPEAESRQPRTPESVMAEADRFAREQLPDHYKLRVLLQSTPDHPIILKLTDNNEHTEERKITTSQPNLDLAREIKRQVQSHLLGVPGITAYRDPLRAARYSIAEDEFIPRPEPRVHVTTRHGEYSLQMKWPRLHEETQLSLGVPHDESESSRTEAQLRADHVTDMLSRVRERYTQGDYLPVTKADVIEDLRQWVAGRGQAFEELTREPIDRFPMAIRLPFSGPNENQDCWLHVEPLKADGSPNYTWIVPLRITVNGQRIRPSADVNLHVRDRHAAEGRAIDTVNQLLLQMNQYARPGGGFALTPDNPRQLQSLSEPERNASPQLIDTNRLQDMYNQLRSPFKQDLDIRMVNAPAETDGRTRFTIGIIRGGCDGLEERVRETADNYERPIVTRSFIVPTAQADQFPRFLLAVQRSFRETVDDAYDPRSRRNEDRAQREVIQWSRKFHPGYAPQVLDDAIRTHLSEFPDIVAERMPRGPRLDNGQHGRT